MNIPQAIRVQLAALSVLLTSTALAQQQPEQTKPASVAVLDFEPLDETSRNQGWAMGLADFMTAALQERGALTLERRDLRLILMERRRQISGLVIPADIVRSALPWVRFLLKGEIGVRADGGFDLSMVLIDAQVGHEAFRKSATGKYPDEVAGVITKLADEVAIHLHHSGPSPPPCTPQPGFTKTPEIALTFYRGVDWLVKGRPELAEQHLRLAYKMDPAFQVARIWRMKAFIYLGLGDFAQLIQADLSRDPIGSSLLKSLGVIEGKLDMPIVVSIIAPLLTETRNRRLEDALAQTLVEEPRVSFFLPRHLRDLTNESDLTLTGEFQQPAIPPVHIVAADILVSIRIVGGGEVDPAMEMTLIDPISGNVLAVGRRTYSETAAKAALKGLFRELRNSILTSASSPTFGLQATNEDPVSYASALGSKGQRYAYHLRKFVESPKDRHKLMTLLAAQDWFYDNVYEGEEIAKLQGLLADRLLGLIDSQEPDAAQWLSQALWLLLRSKLYTLASGLHNYFPKDIVETTFQPLISKFPYSLATFYVHCVIAIEKAVANKHQEAADLLELLVEGQWEFEDHEWPKIFKANLFFFAAREAHLNGRSEQARRYITMAEDEVSPWPAKMKAQYNFALWGVGYAPYNLDHARAELEFRSRATTTWTTTLNYRVGLEYRLLAMGLGYSVETTLAEEVARLRVQILGDVALSSLQGLYSEALSKVGRDGVIARLEYLERLIESVRRGESLNEREINYNAFVCIQWLADIMPVTEIPKIQQLAIRFADACEEETAAKGRVSRPGYRLGVYMAAAMYDQAFLIADQMSNMTQEDLRLLGTFAKSRILLDTHTLEDSARLLERDLDRFERELKPPFSTCHSQLVMKCAAQYRSAGQRDKAAGIYQRGINAQLIHPDSEWTRGYRMSLVFELAKVKAQTGATDDAAALFKQIIDTCAGRQVSYIRANAIMPVSLDRLAIEHLEVLRGNREHATPMWTDYSTERLLRLAEEYLEANNIARGIYYLDVVIARTKGARWNFSDGFDRDDDFALAGQAEARLAQLRIKDDH